VLNALCHPAPPRRLMAMAPGLTYRWVKRGMDIVGALIALTLAAPVLVCCALWIRLVDGPNVLYSQWRVGEHGYLFRIYKLRTMRHDAESTGVRFAKAGDSRVMPGCGWMRRSHVDELPQLLSILWGDMSLVGPRPERPEMVETLRQSIPRIEWRLTGRPGLTGLAQIRSGYANDVAGARRKQAWDLRYLRRRSILGELRIVLGTFPKFWDQAAH